MDTRHRFDPCTRFWMLVSFGRPAALEIPRATAPYAVKPQARLGMRLLDRTTRQVRPAPDGQAFYERCVHVLGELDDAESSLRHVAANPRGTLRMDMSSVHASPSCCRGSTASAIAIPASTWRSAAAASWPTWFAKASIA